jgi:Flp pilus assembly protein CpaB
VSGTPNQVLAGTLRTGDHVDVIGNWMVPEGAACCHFSRVVLRDVKVLKAPDNPLADSKLGQASAQQVSVMLGVTDTQVDKLWWVVNNGSGTAQGWSLALRPSVQASDSPEATEWYWTMLRDGLNRYQMHRAQTGGAR